MNEPDVVVHVHRDPGDFPDQPVVGKHGPMRIHLGHYRVLRVRVVHRCAARPFSLRLTTDGEGDGEGRPQSHQDKSQILVFHFFLPEPLPPTGYQTPAPWRRRTR